MKIRVLNKSGDTLLTDEPITGDRVKNMTTAEVKEEFDQMIRNGYVGIDDDTDTIIHRLNKKTKNITMLFPLQGG